MINPNTIYDIAGDEDEVYLWCEYFKLHMHEAVYKNLLNLDTKKEYKTEMCNIRVDVPIRYISFDVVVNGE